MQSVRLAARVMPLLLFALFALFAGCGGHAASAVDGGADGPGSTALDASVGGADAGASDAPALFGDVYLPPADATSPPPTGDGAPLPTGCDHVCPQGCCLPDNSCVSPGTASACGAGGDPCIVCAPGDSCGNGACVHPQPDCGPTNCAGCCVDASTCATTGRDDVACGGGGQACARCLPAEQAGGCVPQPDGGGACSSCFPCGGCCVAGGPGDPLECLMGISQTECGSLGETCHACTGGTQCTYGGTGGVCVMPEAGACGPATCPGCCDGDVCAVGDQLVACGKGGAACVDCGVYATACVASTCQ
ncbi:MAG TPA: hypothetical protein VGL81_13400 [Polyangiaceae bacterium]